MTILAGVYSPTAWTAGDQVLADAIQTHLSRRPEDPRTLFSDGCLFVCMIDIGVYGEPAWLVDEERVATLTGRPMLGGADRAADLERLASADPCAAAVHDAKGSFCALIYRRRERRLRLLTDLAGLRPFFVAEYDGRWIFSTSLRLFRELPLELEVDLDAVSELATLGYFLLDHTPYVSVRGAAPGECWELGPEGLSRSCYMPWGDLDREEYTLDEGVEAMREAFEAGIDASLASSAGPELVSLSGGLNSALIAAALRRRGVDVQAVASASADPISRYCATTFADSQGIPVSLMPTVGVGWSLEQRLGHAVDAMDARQRAQMRRPRVAWTGKGGSVGLGAVQIDSTYAEAARWRDKGRLVQDFMQRSGVALPPRIIPGYQALEDGLRRHILATLSSFEGLSQSRSFMLFLSLVRQRRHFVMQREDVDLHRIELHTPFCSPQVLRAALRLPIESVRDFTAYVTLIRRHYPQVMASPWRSSPGRLECLLPMPPEARPRFPWFERDPARRADLARAWSLVRHWDLPSGVLNRAGLAFTCAVTETRLREGIYSIRRALVFSDWLHR